MRQLILIKRANDGTVHIRSTTAAQLPTKSIRVRNAQGEDIGGSDFERVLDHDGDSEITARQLLDRISFDGKGEPVLEVSNLPSNARQAVMRKKNQQR